MPQRVLLFDVDGVLIHSRFHPDATKRRLWDEHLLIDMGIDPDKLKGLFGPDFMKTIEGEASLVSVLDAFLPTIGYRGSTMNFVTYWMERDTHINYALMEAIQTLRRNSDVAVYLATNQEHIRAAFLWREHRLGHIFDDMLYAARLGAAKPDRTFYEATTRFLPETGTSPMLFDDSEACVDAANAFGWEGVHFTDLADFTRHPWVASRLP